MKKKNSVGDCEIQSDAVESCYVLLLNPSRCLTPINSPPLLAQGADLICNQALLLQDGGLGRVFCLCHRVSPAGSCHLHQAAGKGEHEVEVLNCVRVLLLLSQEEENQ